MGGAPKAPLATSLYVLVLMLFSLCVCVFDAFWQSSQEQLCELYQQLYDSGQTDNLSRFEKVIFSVIKDVRQQQCENERLERSYKRYAITLLGVPRGDWGGGGIWRQWQGVVRQSNKQVN